MTLPIDSSSPDHLAPQRAPDSKLPGLSGEAEAHAVRGAGVVTAGDTAVVNKTEIGSGARVGRPQPRILCRSGTIVVLLNAAIIICVLAEHFLCRSGIDLVCIWHRCCIKPNFCV